MESRIRYSTIAVALAALALGACSREAPRDEPQAAADPAPAAALPPPPTPAQRFAEQVVNIGGVQSNDAVKITLAGDRFRAGQAAFEPGDRIDAIAALLRDHPSARVMIEGFTDSRGSVALNQRLSAQRADAVKEALVSRGVDASRIETAGRGAAQPVASNDTPGGRAENRRVELTFAAEPTDRLASAPSSPDGG